MDTHLRASRTDSIHERQGLLARQRRPEGFFGRLKQEFYHNQNHHNESIDALNDYLI